jgi:hypothetical protein
MFGWFKKRSDRSAGKDPLLAQIEALLVAQIPTRVQARAITEPVYCLRIWYHGTDTDGNRVPSLMLVKEATRQKLLREKGRPALDYIWFADELTEPGGSYSTEMEDAKLARLCRQWYRRIPEDLDEEEQLRPIREMTQRVAARLNRLDWRALIPATEDFVVYPADSSHTFCDDYGDMKASVPADRIALLRSLGLLGEMFDAPDEEDEDDDEDS